MRRTRFDSIAALRGCCAAFLFAWSATSAQQVTTDGVVVNLGIVPAQEALRADGHRDAHPLHPPPGSQHVLITLEDQNARTRIGDADVAVEVSDPRGHVERKKLLHTQAGGLPDYSELFVFNWSGEYRVRVIVTRRPGDKPIEARYSLHHEV